MVKKVISILLVLSIVFVGGWYTAKELMPDKQVVSTGPVYATKPVTKGDIKVGVDTTGQLNASSSGGIRVPEQVDYELGNLSFKIEEFLVEQNAAIKIGDPVVRLSSASLKEKIANYNKEIEKEKEIRDEIYKKKKSLTDVMGISVDDFESIDPNEGVLVSAPIRGRVTNLTVKEGQSMKKDGSMIAKIVDDSKFVVSFKATEDEFQEMFVGQKVKLQFPMTFEGYYEGTITELNPNPVPNEGKKEGQIGTTYVHWGIIQAKNPGLVQPGMNVTINLTNATGSPALALKYRGKVDSYLDESNVNQTTIGADTTPIATKVFVRENQFVEAGDPIVKIAGPDVRTYIQSQMNTIVEFENQALRTMSENRRLLDVAINMQSNLLVKAPMDGVISGFWSTKGEEVRSGQWIGDVYNTNNMSVYAEVNDLDIVYIKQDSAVQVSVDAIPGKIFEGKVMRISQNKDQQTGVIKYSVEISVKGSDNLRPGMQANCFVDAGESKGTLLVPVEAVFEEEGKPKVELMKDDGTIEVVEIKTGLINDKFVEVLSGLEEGQKVVTGSSSDLMPSQKVEENNSILPTTK